MLQMLSKVILVLFIASGFLLMLNCTLQALKMEPCDYGKRMLAKTTAFGNAFRVLQQKMARISSNDNSSFLKRIRILVDFIGIFSV